MSTSDDTARSWRNVADRHTAAQTAQLERLQHHEPRTLLQLARQSAAKNVTAGMSFDAPTARELAAALTDAADEVELLTYPTQHLRSGQRPRPTTARIWRENYERAL